MRGMAKLRGLVWRGIMCTWLGILASLAAGSGPVDVSLRGISPQDLKFYSSPVIWCKDGSKSFPRERLNDDFCDCVDGTDEPGTSACPDGKFFCQNEGHVGKYIFSSRVNDGICDCCDGSDEYEGKVKCVNTCWEAAKVSRDKILKSIDTLKEGLSIKNKAVETARRKRQENAKELSNLKSEQTGLSDTVSKLKEEKEALEKEERQEQLEKEKREKEEKEREGLENIVVDETSKTFDGKEEEDEDDIYQSLDDTNHPSATAHEAAPEPTDDPVTPELVVAQSVNTADEKQFDDKRVTSDDNDEVVSSKAGDAADVENLSKEELGRLIASRWTGEKTVVQNQADSEVDHDDSSVKLDTQDDESYEHDEDYDDLDEDDSYEERAEASQKEVKASAPVQPPTGSFWSKMSDRAQALLRKAGLSRVSVDKSDAELIRSQYQEASDKLMDVQSRISELESRLKHDIGKEGEFYTMYDQCFEKTLNKYVYKVCPFKQATQVEGHSSTRLGSWDGFKDGYSAMVFDNGEKCWNGPERSMRVNLRCGTKTELLAVDEPSRCEYVAELSSPAACSEEKLQALQQQLSSFRLPGTHEEL